MTQLPQPLSVTGRVTHDPVTRSLLAKPAESGLGWLIWQQGHRAMMQDDGSLGGPPAFLLAWRVRAMLAAAASQ